MKNVSCPNCSKTVLWEPASLYRPFCSERCRLLDLGAWADGSYAIPTNDPLDPDSMVDHDGDDNSDNQQNPDPHET